MFSLNQVVRILLYKVLSYWMRWCAAPCGTIRCHVAHHNLCIHSGCFAICIPLHDMPCTIAHHHTAMQCNAMHCIWCECNLNTLANILHPDRWHLRKSYHTHHCTINIAHLHSSFPFLSYICTRNPWAIVWHC